MAASAEKVDSVEGGDEEGKGGDDEDSIDHICKEIIKKETFYSHCVPETYVILDAARTTR